MKLLPHPLLSLTLVLLWLLLQNSFDAGNLLLALTLGWLIPLFSLRFWPERVRIRRPKTLLRFLLIVFYDIALANLTVAWRVLRGPQHIAPAFIDYPLQLRNDLAISLLANTICLTPGTVSACLSADRRRLLVHALDAPQPEEVAHSIRERYEQPLKEIFENDE